jgi:hypothetical protein
MAHDGVKDGQLGVGHGVAVLEGEGGFGKSLLEPLPVPGPGGHADEDVFKGHNGFLLIICGMVSYAFML